MPSTYYTHDPTYTNTEKTVSINQPISLFVIGYLALDFIVSANFADSVSQCLGVERLPCVRTQATPASKRDSKRQVKRRLSDRNEHTGMTKHIRLKWLTLYGYIIIVSRACIFYVYVYLSNSINLGCAPYYTMMRMYFVLVGVAVRSFICVHN